ncbi:unnamed protein product [Macrosiphum euphorbiae]|uniref:Integrase catalytic domain-containing protein n=1 Tax=Macrosiphum euphorbiae TaxID=13131 RepID=A0AAV0X0V8_9HEMI|nr:unnamed protein product [Macrosiphum euphorbiae]
MAQALEKNAKDFGIRRQVYRTDNALHTMLRMSKALSLLPAEKIAEGFEVVVQEARHSQNVEVAERYISYFRNQWMERVGPESFSVHGMPRRTNNDQEIFHRHLNAIMNCPRPGIWHFTKYGTKYERIQQRPTLRARRQAYVQLDRKISAACERLAQRRISVKEFLFYTGHLAYDAERRRGVRNVEVHNGIVPPHILETIKEQIVTENVQNNVVGGLGVQMQDRFEQQQQNAEQFPVQDVADFEIDENRDPVFHMPFVKWKHREWQGNWRMSLMSQSTILLHYQGK